MFKYWNWFSGNIYSIKRSVKKIRVDLIVAGTDYVVSVAVSTGFREMVGRLDRSIAYILP